jgi:hypothetical protein
MKRARIKPVSSQMVWKAKSVLMNESAGSLNNHNKFSQAEIAVDRAQAFFNMLSHIILITGGWGISGSRGDSQFPSSYLIGLPLQELPI